MKTNNKQEGSVCPICGQTINLKLNWVSIGGTYYHRSCLEKMKKEKSTL